MADIAHEVGALAVMDAAHVAGLIAGKCHKNPFDYGFDVVTTTTHKTLRGPRGGMILSNDEKIGKAIDKSIFPGLQGGPIMSAIAAKAVCFGEALNPKFKVYSKQILKNAKAMEKVYRDSGVRMMGGGTDNHLLLIDLRSLKNPMDGDTAEKLLDTVGITLNKNMVADDTASAMKPSGIRFGTPAITTRGFMEKDCARVAELMLETLHSGGEKKTVARVKKEITTMAKKHPVPEYFV
jgi:glycine hydroxymethyltransferase